MKNPNISKVLKTYRKLNHYSVNDLVLKLEDHRLPVAPKTIYGWESGQTQPDADTLLTLCKIYNIDNILGTFGYNDTLDDFFFRTRNAAWLCSIGSFRECGRLLRSFWK